MKRIKQFASFFMTFIFILSTLAVPASAASKTFYYSGDMYYLYVNGERFQSGIGGDRDRAFYTLIENKMAKGKPHSTFFSYGGQTWPGTKKKSFINAINAGYNGANSKDVGIFYYSGHGDGSGLQLSPVSELSWKDLAVALSNAPVGKMIVMIDACHAGAFYTKGVSQLSSSKAGKLITFVSCSSKQTCSTGQFSMLLKVGLGSAEKYGKSYVFADTNNDSKVTAGELGDFVGVEGLKNYNICPLCYCNNYNQVVFSYDDVRLFVKESTVSVKKNKTYKLTAYAQGTKKITYSSKNSKIASVSSNGSIKGIKKGTTNITVKAGDKSKTIKVTVK